MTTIIYFDEPELTIVEQDIKNACIYVYEQLGFGLSELNYEKALELELRARGYSLTTEYYVNEMFIDSKGIQHQLNQLRIDVLIHEPKILLELKTLKSKLKEDDKEYLQTKRYQKIIKCKEAFLINFGFNGLEFIKIK
jgi:GxxExxY protein